MFIHKACSYLVLFSILFLPYCLLLLLLFTFNCIYKLLFFYPQQLHMRHGTLCSWGGMTSNRVWCLIPLTTMMNSYHYCYYYCYDYDDYPSCCCCSILLNYFPFRTNMICCTLKHLWSSVFLRKTIQMEKKNLTLQFASCLIPLQTLLTSTMDTTATLVFLTMDFTIVAQ